MCCLKVKFVDDSKLIPNFVKRNTNVIAIGMAVDLIGIAIKIIRNL